MRTHLLTLALTLALSCGMSLAQADKPAEPPHGPSDPIKAMEERMVKELDLTADQQKQLTPIMDAYRQSMTNWAKEHAEEFKAAREKMMQAQQSGDEKAIADARDGMQKAMAGRKELADNLQKQLSGILDAKQQEKAKTLFAQGAGGRQGAAVMAALEKVNLTDDQKAKVKEIMDAAKAEVDKAADPQAKGKAMEAGLEKIKALLTAEQKAKFDEALKSARSGRAGGGMFARLNLTDDQQKKVVEIMKAAREKAATATDASAKGQIMQEAFKNVTDNVLTDAQRKQLEDMRSNGPGGASPAPKKE